MNKSVVLELLTARWKKIPAQRTVALRCLEDQHRFIVMFADHVPEAEFRADIVAARPTPDAQPFVCPRGHHTLVPDIVPFDPVALLVDEVRKLAVLLHNGRQRSGDVAASNPAEPVGLIGQVSDLERNLRFGGELDLRVNRVPAGLTAIDLLAVDFHEVLGRSTIAGSKLVDTRRLDLNGPAHDLRSATRIRRGLDAAEALQLQCLCRVHFFVVDVRVVFPGIHRKNRVDELRAPAAASPGHLPDPDHVGLAGEDVDLDRLVCCGGGRRHQRQRQKEQRKNEIPENSGHRDGFRKKALGIQTSRNGTHISKSVVTTQRGAEWLVFQRSLGRQFVKFNKPAGQKVGRRVSSVLRIGYERPQIAAWVTAACSPVGGIASSRKPANPSLPHERLRP